MNSRLLATTSIRLSEICFGMASLTDRRAAAQTTASRADQAAGAVHAAIEAGITTFHYGPGYASGFILKDLFRSGVRQDGLQLIAKLASPTFAENSFSAATITGAVDQILSETGFERITVGQYIFQGQGIAEKEKPDRFAREMQEAVSRCFEKLRREGKVLAAVGFAYSGEFADVMAEAPGMAGVAGFFNLMEHHLYGVLPRLRASGRSLLAMRPFCGGILAEKRPDWESLPDGDRLKTPAMREPFLQREELGRLFAGSGLPFEAVALKYILSFPEVATCIVGLDSREQVERMIGLMQMNVSFLGKAEQIHALFMRQSATCRNAAFHSTKGWQE